MDWARQIDGYCERVDVTYWAEPHNAITNAAFLIVAVIMALRTRGNLAASLLCWILFAIGVGSFLFHTHATMWALLTDVVPIGIFILTYLFLVNRQIAGWPLWAALLGTLAFLPFAAVVVLALDRLPFFRISNFYWSVPLLLTIYAVALRQRLPQVARGFAIGAALLALSITLRSLDEILCPYVPMGTHLLWHCLNAVMLGYMIHVYDRHVK